MTQSPQTQGTIKILNFESAVLRGNPLGDKHIREVCVYLPPQYDGEKRFPVVYGLSGFTGRGRMWLNDSAFTPNFAERMDRLIAAGKIQPMIAVLPDCFTYYGGSQYLNSSATGNYEDYLVKEIAPFVDENFATIADKNARAVMGKSSGGYGALVLATRHADVFGLCASISGDAYFELCYLPDFAKAFRALRAVGGDARRFMQNFWRDGRKNKDDFAALNIIGMSACYSPNPKSEAGFDLPFDRKSGEIRAEVWARWLAHDPARMAADHADALKGLGLLFLDAGARDEFALDVGARVLSAKFNELGIRHVHEEFDDGHFNIGYRYDRSLELISEAVRG